MAEPEIENIEEESDTFEVFSGHKNIYARVSKKNPMNQPCPRCGKENSLTPKDIEIGNVCKDCDKEDEEKRIAMLKQWEKEDREMGLID
mgnify:CR=1 FL=1